MSGGDARRRSSVSDKLRGIGEGEMPGERGAKPVLRARADSKETVVAKSRGTEENTARIEVRVVLTVRYIR